MVGRINKLAMISIVFLSQLTRQNVSLEAYISEAQDYSSNAQQLKKNESNQKEEMSLKEISDQDNKCKILGKTLLTENKSTQAKQKEIMKEKVGTQQDQKHQQNKNQYEKYQQQTEQIFQKPNERNDHKLKFTEQSNKKQSRLLGGGLSLLKNNSYQNFLTDDYFIGNNKMPLFLKSFIEKYALQQFPILEFYEHCIPYGQPLKTRKTENNPTWLKCKYMLNYNNIGSSLVDLINKFRLCFINSKEPDSITYKKKHNIQKLDKITVLQSKDIEQQLWYEASFLGKEPFLTKSEYKQRRKNIELYYLHEFNKPFRVFTIPFTINIRDIDVDNREQMAQEVFRQVFDCTSNYDLFLLPELKEVALLLYPVGSVYVIGRLGIQFRD